MGGNRVRPTRKKGGLNGDQDESPRALLRGPQQPDNDHAADLAFLTERPNVYFAYTEDGGYTRAEAKQPAPKPQKNQRRQSAGRPGTANRKGRVVKSGAAAAANPSSMGNFMHSAEDDGHPETLGSRVKVQIRA